MTSNPIKEIRTDLGLTQEALASIAGTTTQVIQKSEMGLFGSLPPNVIKALVILTGRAHLQIESQYNAWVEESLKEVKLPNGADKMILDPIQFMEWKQTVCGLNGVSDTTYSFCKLFKIHPYVIEKWEGGKLKSAPLDLITRVAKIRGLI